MNISCEGKEGEVISYISVTVRTPVVPRSYRDTAKCRSLFVYKFKRRLNLLTHPHLQISGFAGWNRLISAVVSSAVFIGTDVPFPVSPVIMSIHVLIPVEIGKSIQIELPGN
jgi:hypothetical protein